jgi:hypothetical protein
MRITSAKALIVAIIVVACTPTLMQHLSSSTDTSGEQVYNVQMIPKPMLSATMDSEPAAPTHLGAELLRSLASSCDHAPAACAEYSTALRHAGRAAEARGAAETGLRRDPALWPLWTALGLLLASDGDTAAARCVISRREPNYNIV